MWRRAENFDRSHAILRTTSTHAAPAPDPRGEFFKVEIFCSRIFLGTLNTMVILLKLLLNVVWHFTLRKNNIFAPPTPPQGLGQISKPNE